jgi:hypothetical protein
LRVVLAFLMMLAHASAWAEWVKVTEGQSFSIYVDPATIRAAGDIRRAWQLTDYKEAVLPEGYLSSLDLLEFDCNEGRRRMLSFSEHLGPMGTGAVRAAPASGEASPWRHDPPASVGEATRRYVCSR